MDVAKSAAIKEIIKWSFVFFHNNFDLMKSIIQTAIQIKKINEKDQIRHVIQF